MKKKHTITKDLILFFLIIVIYLAVIIGLVKLAYKLKNTSKSSGYYCIYNSSRQDKIVENDFFENTTYVKVARGQYLVLDRCLIVK